MLDDLTRERVLPMLERAESGTREMAQMFALIQHEGAPLAKDDADALTALIAALRDAPARWCGVVGVVYAEQYATGERGIGGYAAITRPTGRLIVTPHATEGR